MTARCGAARQAEAGFTLLELLIALVVFSLLMTLLVNGLQLTAKSWTTVSSYAADRLVLRTTRQSLRRQLQQLVPYRKLGQRNGVPRILFDGDRAEIVFVGRLPDHVGGMLQRFRLTRTDDVLELQLASIGAVPNDQASWSDPLPLLDGIQDLRFTYFDGHADEGDHWVNRWRDRITLPQTIKIEISLVDGKPEDWPPLLVRPMINCHQPC